MVKSLLRPKKTKQQIVMFPISRRTVKTKSLRKHAYSNIPNSFPPKNENFQIKNSDLFHDSAENILLSVIFVYYTNTRQHAS